MDTDIQKLFPCVFSYGKFLTHINCVLHECPPGLSPPQDDLFFCRPKQRPQPSDARPQEQPTAQTNQNHIVFTAAGLPRNPCRGQDYCPGQCDCQNIFQNKYNVRHLYTILCIIAQFFFYAQ